MTRWFLLMLAGSLLAACAYAADPIVGEPKELQGSWVLETLQINGDAVAIDNLKVNSTPLAPRLNVKGTSYTLYLADKPFAMTCQVDPKRSPKWITLTVQQGPEKGKAFRGIYKVDGDRFTICRALNPDQPRPTEFTTAAKSGLIMGVWKRTRP